MYDACASDRQGRTISSHHYLLCFRLEEKTKEVIPLNKSLKRDQCKARQPILRLLIVISLEEREREGDGIQTGINRQRQNNAQQVDGYQEGFYVGAPP